MNNRASAKHSKAMTLTELMLALFVTSMIGAAAVTVMSTAAGAQARTQATAQTIQAGRSGFHQLQRHIRGARLVTGCSEQTLVLWRADTADHGYINADELLVLQFDEQAAEITATQITWPVEMPKAQRDALNIRCTLANLSTPAAALAAMGNVAYRRQQVIATDVRSMQFETPSDAPLSRCVIVTMAFGDQPHGLTLAATTTLRAPAVDLVMESDGQYILLEPDED